MLSLIRLSKLVRCSPRQPFGHTRSGASGVREGLPSVRVSGNWRIAFRLDDGHVFDVDLADCR